MVVVDEVLVGERQSIDALPDQVLQRVYNPFRRAQVAEAAGNTIGQTDRSVGRTKQQNTAVRRDGAAVESANKLAASAGSEVEGIGATVCRDRGSSVASGKSLQHNHFR